MPLLFIRPRAMKARLFGGPQRAVAVHLSTEVTPGRDARADVAALATALGPIDAFADSITGAR